MSEEFVCVLYVIKILTTLAVLILIRKHGTKGIDKRLIFIYMCILLVNIYTSAISLGSKYLVQ